MNAEEILVNAKALIQDPDHWCQEHLAVRALKPPSSEGLRRVIGGGGWVTSPQDEAADRWCVRGAMFKCTGDESDIPIHLPDEHRKAVRCLEQASSRMFGLSPIKVNDRLTHAAVMRMLDRAIELAKVDQPQILIPETIEIPEPAEPKVLIEA